MELSLFYFADHSTALDPGDRYRLLLEGARFADEHGFCAVWTPERHFHPFGGLYPNPAVTGAAVAAITRRVRIRAGSVVLPLHDPVRVAEEWSVVDNLSGGRVDVSFASGWHAVDFSLRPDAYAGRRRHLLEAIEVVRALWRGEPVTRSDGAGNPVALRIFPPPVQPELPFWITSSTHVETCRAAGRLGANLLTHLLGQDLVELREKIAAYREALPDGRTGHVTLMLHTFLGDDVDAVREMVRRPFSDYLRSSFDLVAAWARSVGDQFHAAHVTEHDVEFLVGRAFERYFETSGLFGTIESAARTLEELARAGVDEVGCLIDFGVDHAATLASLRRLAALRQVAAGVSPGR